MSTDSRTTKTATAIMTDFTGCGGFTEAERRGVRRLADRIRFELHCCRGEESAYLSRKRITLAVLDEALS